MIKLATITPVNCITREQDGQIFTLCWDHETGIISAKFENGEAEALDYTADTLESAIDIVYSLYDASIAFVYEPHDVEYEA